MDSHLLELGGIEGIEGIEGNPFVGIVGNPFVGNRLLLLLRLLSELLQRHVQSSPLSVQTPCDMPSKPLREQILALC